MLDIPQPFFKRRRFDVMQKTVKVMMGIFFIIEVELRNTELQEAPERFAQIRTETHEVEVRQVGRSHFTEVGAQQQFALFIIQRLVDGKIPQVKENVSHSGIFPIKNPDGSSIIDEIAGKQVVMAGLQRNY